MLSQTKTKAWLLASVLALILLFSLTACSGSNAPSGNGGNASPTPSAQDSTTPAPSPTDAATPEPAYVSTLSLSDYSNTDGVLWKSNNANGILWTFIDKQHGQVVELTYDDMQALSQSGVSMNAPLVNSPAGEIYMDLFNFCHGFEMRELPPDAARARDDVIRFLMEYTDRPEMRYGDVKVVADEAQPLIEAYEQAMNSDPGTTPQQPATSPSPGTDTPSPSPSPTPATLTLGFDLTIEAGWVAALDAAHDNTDKARKNVNEAFQNSRDYTQEGKQLRAGWKALHDEFDKQNRDIILGKREPFPIYEGYSVMGDIVNGKPDGLCYLIWKRADSGHDFAQTITGTFKDGKLNGFASINNHGEYVEDKYKYIGYLKDGKYHGLGHLDSGDTVMEGEWNEGSFTGYGGITIYTEKGRGLGNPFTSYKGYFENGVLQGAGEMNQLYNSDGTSISVYAIFDGDNAHILDIEDISARASEAISATVAAMNRADEIAGNSQDRYAAILAQNKASLEKFKAGLAASQPPPRYIPVPNYSGVEAYNPLSGKWESAWTWVLGD